MRLHRTHSTEFFLCHWLLFQIGPLKKTVQLKQMLRMLTDGSFLAWDGKKTSSPENETEFVFLGKIKLTPRFVILKGQRSTKCWFWLKTYGGVFTLCPKMACGHPIIISKILWASPIPVCCWWILKCVLALWCHHSSGEGGAHYDIKVYFGEYMWGGSKFCLEVK